MTKIHLGHTLEDMHITRHNGPGWRVNIWVQGCVHRCTQDCLNPHYLKPGGGFTYTPEEVYQGIIKSIAADSHPVEGITVLGGEPLEQSEDLAELLGLIKTTPLSTMVYTGFIYENLLKTGSNTQKQVFEYTDILVDGPFLAKEYDQTIAWRGSKNQRLICLSNRYTLKELGTPFNDKIQSKAFFQALKYEELPKAFEFFIKKVINKKLEEYETKRKLDIDGQISLQLTALFKNNPQNNSVLRAVENFTYDQLNDDLLHTLIDKEGKTIKVTSELFGLASDKPTKVKGEI